MYNSGLSAVLIHSLLYPQDARRIADTQQCNAKEDKTRLLVHEAPAALRRHLNVFNKIETRLMH